jgi:hypothetical protein
VRAQELLRAARANRTIFYDGNGSPRSFAEIRDRFAAKLGGSTPMPSAPRTLATEPTTMAVLETGAARPAGPTPEYARLAYLMLAALGD